MNEEPENALEPEARRKAGHYEILGETYAKFEFFENGWNPYSRFLDVDKVDLILRRRDTDQPIYREVQVKYGVYRPRFPRHAPNSIHAAACMATNARRTAAGD